MDIAELLDTASREALAVVDSTTPSHPPTTAAWSTVVHRALARGVTMRRLHLTVGTAPITEDPIALHALTLDAAAGHDIRIGSLHDHPEYRIGLWIIDRVLLLPLDGSGRLALAGADALRWCDRFDAAVPFASFALNSTR